MTELEKVQELYKQTRALQTAIREHIGTLDFNMPVLWFDAEATVSDLQETMTELKKHSERRQ